MLLGVRGGPTGVRSFDYLPNSIKHQKPQAAFWKRDAQVRVARKPFGRLFDKVAWSADHADHADQNPLSGRDPGLTLRGEVAELAVQPGRRPRPAGLLWQPYFSLLAPAGAV